MRYLISLILPEESSNLRFFDFLASSDNVVEGERSNSIRTQDGTTIAVMGGNEDGFQLIGGSGAGLYFFLTSYFSWHGGRLAGATIVDLNAEQAKALIITNDPEDDVGHSGVYTVIFSGELLATEPVFLAAWPNLWTSDEEEEFPPEPEIVIIDEGRSSIFNALHQDPENEHETVSFILVSSNPLEVFDAVVSVPSYYAEDPEYLVSTVHSIDASIIAVVFNTDRGLVTELRVPLQQKDITEAQRLISASNSSSLNLEIYYVTDISEDQETFTIQPIGEGGFLGAPESLQLRFN